MTTNQRHRTVLYFRRGRGFRPWLIRILTRSDVSHVAIGYGSKVFEVNYHLGGIYWSRNEYLSLPDACIGIGVEANTMPDLDSLIGSPKPSVWRVVLKVATKGRAPYGHDCVDLAQAVLATIGMWVPSNVTTPGKLMDFMMEAMVNDWIDNGKADATPLADAQR